VSLRLRLAALAWLWGVLVLRAQPAPPSIPIPGGEAGVGFDDLRYSTSLGRLIVPAGRTGAIVLVDPKTWSVTRIGGFASSASFDGGHGEGVTSADEGRGFLFAADRSMQRLVVVDPAEGRVTGWAKLSAGPDYVRYVSRTNEVWVTEPDAEKIEVFRLEDNPPRPIRDGEIEIKGGPESLVVDEERGIAYTHLWKGETVAVPLKNRTARPAWKNGCEGSRGIALDASHGLLFVGCSEGKAVTLDAKTGKIVSTVKVGAGVDIVDYSPSRGHLYVPGGKSATMAIVDVAPEGALGIVDTVPTAEKGHCVASDPSGNVYVCDPKGGRILVIPDHYEAAPRNP
jgi:DNA-binding beta-propeller fold protein YncE